MMLHPIRAFTFAETIFLNSRGSYIAGRGVNMIITLNI